MTTAKKLWLGFGTLIFLMLITTLVILLRLRMIESEFDQVETLKEPTSAAAHEMQLRIVGMSVGVGRYLIIGDPAGRSRVERDSTGFERSFATYNELVASDPTGAVFGVLCLESQNEYATGGFTTNAEADVTLAAHDRALTQAIIANVAFGVGGAAVIAGVVLFFTLRGGGEEPEAEEPAVTFAPVLGPAVAGISLRGAL